MCNASDCLPRKTVSWLHTTEMHIPVALCDSTKVFICCKKSLGTYPEVLVTKIRDHVIIIVVIHLNSIGCI